MNILKALPILLLAATSTNLLAYVSSGGDEFTIEYNENGAVLLPVNNSSSKMELYIGKDCDAFSKIYGKGKWEWDNDGFWVELPSKTISFGRQVIDISNGSCRASEKSSATLEKEKNNENNKTIILSAITQPKELNNPIEIQKRCENEYIIRSQKNGSYRGNRSYLDASEYCKSDIAIKEQVATDKKNIEELNKIRNIAENGNSEAQYSLGEKYYFYWENYIEAAKWYRKAAIQGHAKSQSSLGQMYSYGQGFNKDMQEGTKWQKKSAEQGYARAQMLLGSAYQNGYGVTKDLEEAYKWYSKAAEQGDPLAQLWLGEMYENGEWVEKNLEEAIKWYQKAAADGWKEAKEALMYAKEDLEEENKLNSRVLLENTALLCNMISMYTINTNSKIKTDVSNAKPINISRTGDRIKMWYSFPNAPSIVQNGAIFNKFKNGESFYTKNSDGFEHTIKLVKKNNNTIMTILSTYTGMPNAVFQTFSCQ